MSDPNVRKFVLRTHQAQVDRILKFASPKLKTLICDVTPGGGKGLIPVIAANRLIPAGKASALCWASPRQALSVQAEEVFINKDVKRFFGHNYEIRNAAGNDAKLGDGVNGYSTLYQSIMANPSIHMSAFMERPHILVLDEPHHYKTDSKTASVIEALAQKAAFVILMSGSFERHDEERIMLLDYINAMEPNKHFVDFSATEEREVVRYSLADALAARAIVQAEFPLVDAKSEWESKETGEIFTVNSLKEEEDEFRARRALWYGINDDDYAFELLTATVNKWRDYREGINPKAKLLVIAARKHLAKKYLTRLRELGVTRASIAVTPEATQGESGLLYEDEAVTPDEMKDALRNIARLKGRQQPELDALVTVGMAYEGLDCPAIKGIACLTHFRSKPYIEQVIARATRFDQAEGAGSWEEQHAFIFAPDDKMFRECVRKIREAQAPFAVDRPPGGDGKGPLSKPVSSKFSAIGTSPLNTRVVTLLGTTIEAEEYAKLKDLADRAGLSHNSIAQIRTLAALIEASNEVRDMTGEAPKLEEALELTISNKEKNIKRDITSFIKREICGADGKCIEEVNRFIWKTYEKSRIMMTLPELEKVYSEREVWAEKVRRILNDLAS